MPAKLKLSDYKLIVFDIDGTLVGADHKIHPFTRDVLLKLHGLAVPFTLATGKILPATKAQADELQVELPLILSNGSVVQRRTGEILFHICLPAEATDTVIGICEDRREDLVIYVDDRIFIKEMNENIYPIYSMVKSGLYEIGDWSKLPGGTGVATKCLVIDHADPKNLLDLEKLFLQETGEEADIVKTSLHLLEVMPKGVNKAKAVRRLADEMGIEMREVMAFGDYDNDAAMLSAAGLGVAVANASRPAKQAADLVIGSCGENAPAEFLDELIKGSS